MIGIGNFISFVKAGDPVITPTGGGGTSNIITQAGDQIITQAGDHVVEQ